MNNLFKHRQAQILNFKNLRKRPPTTLSCPVCGSPVDKELLYVCPQCGEHLRIGAYERISQIVDEKSFKELFRSLTTQNKDHFEGYDEKLDKAKQTSGLNEAVVCGVGKINGQKVAIAVMDANFMMGSMGEVVGEKITRLIEHASKRKLPLIIFCASGGARMQEGIISLMQMAKTSAALERFKGLYISVLTHPTTGGVSASFAMLGDIILSEPKAMIGFAGKRVIQDTIKEELPDDFQTAEFLLDHGFVDVIVARNQMKQMLSDLITLHGGYDGK